MIVLSGIIDMLGTVGADDTVDRFHTQQRITVAAGEKVEENEEKEKGEEEEEEEEEQEEEEEEEEKEKEKEEEG